MSGCPVPGCTNELPGDWAVLCTDHYFALDPVEAKFLVKMKVLAKRAKTDDARDHLEKQLGSYIRNAVAKIGEPA